MIDNAGASDPQAKAIALANGTDDVSILSQLTEKTLKAATSATIVMNRNTQDDLSIESGNTSCSKTQAAVKEALKEVSLEHNKAMEEQRLKFQRELEELRNALNRNNNQIVASPNPNTSTSDTRDNPHIATPTEMDLEEHSLQDQKMDIDSSDDEVALASSRQSTRRTAVSAKDNKS